MEQTIDYRFHIRSSLAKTRAERDRKRREAEELKARIIKDGKSLLCGVMKAVMVNAMQQGLSNAMLKRPGITLGSGYTRKKIERKAN